MSQRCQEQLSSIYWGSKPADQNLVYAPAVEVDNFESPSLNINSIANGRDGTELLKQKTQQTSGLIGPRWRKGNPDQFCNSSAGT
ncbi:hypothetical protein V1294_001596 [Bradyrhizobium sp. AZCC 1678]